MASSGLARFACSSWFLKRKRGCSSTERSPASESAALSARRGATSSGFRAKSATRRRTPGPSSGA